MGAEQAIVGKRRTRFVDAVILYALLSFCGIVGVLARIGLTRLTQFQGHAYGGVLWANFTGSLVMGLLVNNKVFFGSLLKHDDIEHDSAVRPRRVYKTMTDIPLYAALATGACGSITTFSSFELILFEVSANQGSSTLSYPNAGYGVMAWMSYVIITMAVSTGGFRVGQHITRMFGEYIFPLVRYELVIETVLALLGAAGWIVTLVLGIVMNQSSWRYWCLSCVFAPFGVFLRHWFSKLLNKRSKKFMFGTFTANMVSMLLISTVALLQRGKTNTHGKIITSMLQCNVLAALQDGFAGNLSTISSFVSELAGMPRLRYAYMYGAATVFAGYAIIVLILGSFAWTHQLAPSCQKMSI